MSVKNMWHNRDYYSTVGGHDHLLPVNGVVGPVQSTDKGELHSGQLSLTYSVNKASGARCENK